MIKRVYCGKKTKIYIPKIENPKIITSCTILKEPETTHTSVLSTGGGLNDNDKRR